MRYKKGKRGSIINKYGVKITKKEQEEIRNLVKEINKLRKKMGKELPNMDDIYQNLGMENPLNIARRSRNMNQFKNEGLLKAWKKQAKAILRNPKKYLSKKLKTFYNNYIQSILNNYSLFNTEHIEDVIDYLPESVKDLLLKVLNDTPEEFYAKYQYGEYPDISENYIPQEQYEDMLDEVYSIYDDSDNDDIDKDSQLISLYNKKHKRR